MSEIIVNLTPAQVSAWLNRWEHLPEGDDRELANLWSLVDDTPRKSRGVILKLTNAQACDLMSYFDYAADGPADTIAERSTQRAFLNAMKRLREAGAETITEFNARMAQEKKQKTSEQVQEKIAEQTEPAEVEDKPVKVRKPRRASFTTQVADAIRIAAPDGATDKLLSTGQRVTVERDAQGHYTVLIIKLGVGKYFEFRCPFSASNAGVIATQVWKLMQSMEM